MKTICILSSFTGPVWRRFLCAIFLTLLPRSASTPVMAEAAAAIPAVPEHTISLAGVWQLALAEPKPSFPQTALPADLKFSDTIELPGTTETRAKGPLNPDRETGMLTRVRKFTGPAWYRRSVEIPPGWRGQRIHLLLERTKFTQLWFDDHPRGSQVLYGSPQSYDLTDLATPGNHTLTLMVDNRLERRPMQGQAHQNSDDTQTIWNGIIGRIELVATDPVWLDDLQVYPDLARHAFRVSATIGNATGSPVSGILSLQAESFNHDGPPHRPAPVHGEFRAAGATAGVELQYPLGPDARRWDEFAPNLYRLTVILTTPAGREVRSVETGLRDFKPAGTHFAINGRITFLRGKHDGCVFPLTGHPPMEVEGWLRYLGICRQYGINHIRCHTWIPPEAAFAAADRLGIYLQPELPFWGTFDAQTRDALMPEALALLRTCGNHPSFVMLTLGNEIGGDRALMNAMVARLREIDPRRLYADGSNNVFWEPRLQPTNDFWTSAKAINSASDNRAVAARGSFCVLDSNDGHTQWGAAETRTDLSPALAGIPVPFVGHETAQWTTYPDYREIAKYTGVVRARNLERFRDLLTRHGMLDQAGLFFRASGALSAQLYREENELFLRTPGMGGFQLLDLQDYPGQGTALVGMLDAFMDSKGLITPEAWRRSCAPLVVLARFDRYTWTTTDTYSADLEFAQYGPADLAHATTHWALKAADGSVLAEATWPPALLAQGGLRRLGRVEASLARAAAPARYTLEVTVANGAERVENAWPLWVYPARVDTATPANVTVVHAFDGAAKQLLAAGRRVLLVPSEKDWADTVGGAYATDYWCWPMFNNTPGTMGLLCDPKHPALALSPTAFHSERQWSAIAHTSTPVILANTPADFRPIVQVIDNLERNEKLGLVFEAKVGAGSLLVCAVDLFALQDRPEARQLLASLLAYAASARFAPKQGLDVAALDSFLRPSLAQGKPVKASSCFHPPWGAVPVPERAVDGDINTRWIAAESDRSPTLEVDLGRACTIDTVGLLWEHDESGYRYLLEVSADGTDWSPLSDQRDNRFPGSRHLLSVHANGVRHLRLTATGTPPGGRFCLRDLRVLGE